MQYGSLQARLSSAATASCYMALNLLFMTVITVLALRHPRAYCALRTPLLMAIRMLRSTASSLVVAKVCGGAG